MKNICFPIFQFPWHKTVWNILWRIKKIETTRYCWLLYLPYSHKMWPLPPLLQKRPLLLLHSNGSTAIKKESPRSSLTNHAVAVHFYGSVPYQTTLWNLLWALSWTRSCWGDGKVTRIGKIGWSSIFKGPFTGKHVFPWNIEFFLQFFPSNPGIVEPIPKSEISRSFLFNNGSAFGLLCWTELYIYIIRDPTWIVAKQEWRYEVKNMAIFTVPKLDFPKRAVIFQDLFFMRNIGAESQVWLEK